eukprot:GHUV01040331.1.p1 GENE.GHUV01040331.1~~GHUV01040331.1.p1  ORF type:complete len:122 (+),score=13.34 GHUV01040331.1:245-610(+)
MAAIQCPRMTVLLSFAAVYLPTLCEQTTAVFSDLSLPCFMVAPVIADSCKERKIPDWGKQIFSPLCVCIKPEAPEELAGFMKYAVALTRAHLMVSWEYVAWLSDTANILRVPLWRLPSQSS